MQLLMLILYLNRFFCSKHLSKSAKKEEGDKLLILVNLTIVCL